tara:strand:+ start:583 stop:822 length:240 start_codon:yes stop_codon:yes gene_type:complete
MTEQNLHDYNKWLMEVWNPNQLYIPFAIDAPKAFLDYQAKQLIIADVVVPKGTLCEHDYQPDITCGVDITACTKCGDVI